MGPRPGLFCSIRLNTALTAADKALYQDPAVVQEILRTTRRIVIVGLSSDRQKASYFVASYLKSAGWEVVPVNPKADRILGLKVYPSLAEVPGPLGLVDIFRPTAEAGAFVDQAIALGATAVWQQLRVTDLAAAARAREAGLLSVVDLCVKMEHGRYGGGLHEAGMNTELVTARREHRYV